MELTKYICHRKPDFNFIYLGLCDGAGHRDGWGSELQRMVIDNAVDCMKKVVALVGKGVSGVPCADPRS